MPVDAVVNILISGLLTGLVYGLMALGLSVIYGVVRIVNFAHGEMMTVAMYATVLLFAAWHVDPRRRLVRRSVVPTLVLPEAEELVVVDPIE